MRPRNVCLAVIVAVSLILESLPVLGGIPGGMPLPTPDNAPHVLHWSARLGFSLLARAYRYQGDYGLTYNIAQVGPTMAYFFANVDVEALSDLQSSFRPDHLTGTFEVGGRRILGTTPVSLYLRHESPHDLDRADRKQGSWEQVGARVEHKLGRTHLTLSSGWFYHTVVDDYRWDVDLHASRAMGRVWGLPWDLQADLHQMQEDGTRSNYTDFWIEPAVALSDHLQAFAAFGQVHDIDVFHGKTEMPLQTGVKFRW